MTQPSARTDHNLALANPDLRSLILGVGAASGLGIVMGKLTEGPLKEPVKQFDTGLSHATSHFRSSALDPIMSGLSKLGEPQALYGATGLLAVAWLAEHKAGQSATLVCAVAGSATIDKLIKGVVKRPRPILRLPFPRSKAAGSSFPSNHSMMSLATYGAIAYMVARKSRRTKSANPQGKADNTGEQNSAVLASTSPDSTTQAEQPSQQSSRKGRRPHPVKHFFLRTGMPAILCALIGWSRVYQGVHNPSDVIGGWIVGGIWLAACTRRDRAAAR